VREGLDPEHRRREVIVGGMTRRRNDLQRREAADPTSSDRIDATLVVACCPPIASEESLPYFTEFPGARVAAPLTRLDLFATTALGEVLEWRPRYRIAVTDHRPTCSSSPRLIERP
jgi:hypothetical protein